MNLFKSIFGKKEKEIVTPLSFNTEDFKKLISKYFAPKLREQGWKGSGLHFRKITDGPYIHFLSFQPNKYGGECWVEVGIHLDFLKDDEGKPYDLQKLNCSWLDIRRRISPKNSENFSWKYENTEDQNKQMLEDIWNTFQSDGQTFFELFTEFPKPFDNIEIEDLEIQDNNGQINGIPFPPDVRTAWYLSQVNDFIGNKEKTRNISNFGLSRIEGCQGSGLRAELERLRDKNTLNI